MVIPILSSVSVFFFFATAGVWVAQRARGTADKRVQSLAAERQAYERLQDVPFEQRIVFPAAEGLARFVIGALPPAFIARIRRRLAAAGDPMSVSTFFLLALISTFALPAMIVFITLVGTGGEVTATVWMIGIMSLIFGLMLPFFLLSRRVRSRQTAIWRSLPDAFDLMTTCVEAGLGLDSAFHRVSEKMRGPVGDEFAEMLREVALGKARRDAIRDMGERTGVADLQTFANMIVQAEELGTSLGAALRAQAADMRRHRRQRAEEEARRAPAKMVFPLVFFILPSLFIVILGPVFIELVKTLGE